MYGMAGWLDGWMMDRWMDQSINRSIDQSTNQWMDGSIDRSINQLCGHMGHQPSPPVIPTAAANWYPNTGQFIPNYRPIGCINVDGFINPLFGYQLAGIWVPIGNPIDNPIGNPIVSPIPKSGPYGTKWARPKRTQTEPHGSGPNVPKRNQMDQHLSNGPNGSR